jgi:hypothetical protein
VHTTSLKSQKSQNETFGISKSPALTPKSHLARSSSARPRSPRCRDDDDDLLIVLTETKTSLLLYTRPSGTPPLVRALGPTLASSRMLQLLPNFASSIAASSAKSEAVLSVHNNLMSCSSCRSIVDIGTSQSSTCSQTTCLTRQLLTSMYSIAEPCWSCRTSLTVSRLRPSCTTLMTSSNPASSSSAISFPVSEGCSWHLHDTVLIILATGVPLPVAPKLRMRLTCST